MKFVSRAGFGIQKAIAALCTTGLLASTTLAQANPTLPSAPAGPQQSPPQTIEQQAQAAAAQPVVYQGPFNIELPHSRNPLAPYMPSTVPELNLQNSHRLYDLIQDGKLRISLQDAIALALENNLTLASFRYNFPIAQADLLRTKAGGVVNGVNITVVSTTRAALAPPGAAVAPQPRMRPQAPAASSPPLSAPARPFPRSTPSSASPALCNTPSPRSRTLPRSAPNSLSKTISRSNRSSQQSFPLGT